MKKLFIIVATFSILIVLGLIKLVPSEAQRKNFISEEKAWSIFAADPNIKLLTKEWKGSHTRIKEFPREDSPYYVFYVKQDECGNNNRFPICESLIIYLDANTGNVVFKDDLEKRISAIKESQKLTQKLIEEEKPFKIELENKFREFERLSWLGKEQCDEVLKSCLPIFLEALEKTTADIRTRGAHILSSLATRRLMSYKAKEAMPKLLELLKDGDYGVRYGSVRALGNIADKGDKKVIEAILPLIKDEDALVRREAIDSLSKIGDRSLVSILIPFLEDTSVNQEAVKALGDWGDEVAVEPLMKLFNNKEKQYYILESAIIETLGNIGGQQARSILIGLLNKSYTINNKVGLSFEPPFPYMGADVARALAETGKDSLPYLVESLRSQDYLQRLYAVYTMSLIKEAAAIESLAQALKTEENAIVKTYIEKAIAGIKGEEFVSPLLKQLKIKVVIPSKKYRLGSAIKASICVQNSGLIPVVINTVPLNFVCASFIIVGPDGIGVSPRAEYDWCPFPNKDSLVTLEAGKKFIAGPFNLREYKVDKPGRYRVIGIYSNSDYACGIEFGVYALTGMVKSEEVIIDIE